jgi:hypothetical protein
MPLYLLPVLGGVAVVALSAEAARHLAWVPLINVAVLLRLVLAGEADPADFAVVLGSLAALAAGALLLAARVGRREEALFDPEPSLRRLLFGPRRTR